MFEKKKERHIETFEIVELTVVTMRHLQDNWGKKNTRQKARKEEGKKGKQQSKKGKWK